jgi:hypothetical protein
MLRVVTSPTLVSVIMLSVVAPPFEANKLVFVNKRGGNIIKLFGGQFTPPSAYLLMILTEVMAIVV